LATFPRFPFFFRVFYSFFYPAHALRLAAAFCGSSRPQSEASFGGCQAKCVWLLRASAALHSLGLKHDTRLDRGAGGQRKGTATSGC
jgi:hypothetical protein